MRSLYLSTIITSTSLWIQRIWAPDKFTGLKNSLVTTFKSIFIRTRQMKLLMPCLNTLSKVQRRKRLSKPKMSKFCTAYSLYWPTPASQASVAQSSYCYSNKSSSMEPTLYPSFSNFGDNIQSKLANKSLYKVNISGMRLQLAELQESKKKV